MASELYQTPETRLLETLRFGLDARESAKRAGSPLLVYLADMLIERAREELNHPDLMKVDPEFAGDVGFPPHLRS